MSDIDTVCETIRSLLEENNSDGMSILLDAVIKEWMKDVVDWEFEHAYSGLGHTVTISGSVVYDDGHIGTFSGQTPYYKPTVIPHNEIADLIMHDVIYITWIGAHNLASRFVFKDEPGFRELLNVARKKATVPV